MIILKQFMILLVLFSSFFVKIKAQQDLSLPFIEKKEDKEKWTDSPFSEINIFKIKAELENAQTKNDTTAIISALSNLGYIYANHANYAKSYSHYWDALILADATKDSLSIASLHEGLAWLYANFHRKKDAQKYYLSALSINKKLVKNGIAQRSRLKQNYYALAVFHRDYQDIYMAKQYLDSCYLLHYEQPTNPDRPFFLEAEKSFIKLDSDNPHEALNDMKEIYWWFEKNAPTYLSILCVYMGDAAKKTGLIQESEKYYLTSLKIIQKLKSHKNYLPIITEKLANLYIENKQFEKGCKFLKIAKKSNEQLFDSRSMNNRPLLELNDIYMKKKNEQKRLLQAKQLETLQQDEKIRKLQITILGLISILISLGAFFYIRHLKIKNTANRAIELKQMELENKKNSELLDLKNKELTASALQLIEKDELLKNLKTALTTNPQKHTKQEIHKIFKTIAKSNTQMWRDFESRFTSVNKYFYENLNKTHPDLTPGDKKLCALIKLDFTGKEIAQIMGISVESVHTHRHRLRKKLGLNRSDNLSKYIEEIERK